MKKRSSFDFACALTIGLYIRLPVQAADTWYVSQSLCIPSATGTAGDPFCSIQVAIDTAVDGDRVLVEPGTYTESLTFGQAAIVVESTAGAELTVLMGTSASPVIRFEGSAGYNSQLRGFTITSGQGGIHVSNSSPVIERCIITDNVAEAGGGIALINGASPVIRDCTIFDNQAVTTGGGIDCKTATRPLVERCRIELNSAMHGAGVYVHDTATPTFQDTVIHMNSAAGSGGGMTFNGNRGRATMERCVISSNDAIAAAGIDCFDAHPFFRSCTIEGNIAAEIAGGLNCKNSAYPTLTNCVIRNNRAEQFNGGGITISLNSFPTIADCSITENFARNGGGFYVYENSSPLVRGCLIANNRAEKVGDLHGFAGGLALSGGNPVIYQCDILENVADAAGGIGHGGPAGTVRGCVIEGNRAARVGGGILCNNSALRVENSLLARNTAMFGGGGVYNYSFGNPTLWACTLVRNSAASGSALYGGAHSFPQLSSCIVWANSADQIRMEGDSGATVRHSTVQGGWTGVANSSQSPQFISEFDFRLKPGSPAIDTGIFEGTDKGPGVDLDGHARVLCHGVDKGAYEFGIGDANCDRAIDLSDWSLWAKCFSGPSAYYSDISCAAFDFESNYVVDLADFSGWQRALDAP